MDKNEKKSDQKDDYKKKGFWKGMVEKVDKLMLEKANQSSCCGKDSKGGKCC